MNPPSTYNSTFTSVKTNYCKLYVPIGTKDTYAFAEGWNLFLNIIEENVVAEGDRQCEAPEIAYEDGHLKFKSATPNATYLYTIRCSDAVSELTNSESGDVALNASYDIVAYANAEGYGTSAAAYATLHWLSASLSMEDGVNSLQADRRPVIVSSSNGTVMLKGIDEGETVAFYGADGRLMGQSAGRDGIVTFKAVEGSVIVAKIGNEAIKVLVK